MTLVGSSEQAQKILLEVFSTVWRKHNADLGNEGLLSLALFYARQLSLNLQEKVPDIKKFPPNPLATDNLSGLNKKVSESFHKLSEDQKILLTIGFFEGLDQHQIAEKYSLPLTAVRARMLSGMLKLHKFFKENGQ